MTNRVTRTGCVHGRVSLQEHPREPVRISSGRVPRAINLESGASPARSGAPIRQPPNWTAATVRVRRPAPATDGSPCIRRGSDPTAFNLARVGRCSSSATPEVSRFRHTVRSSTWLPRYPTTSRAMIPACANEDATKTTSARGTLNGPSMTAAPMAAQCSFPVATPPCSSARSPRVLPSSRRKRVSQGSRARWVPTYLTRSEEEEVLTNGVSNTDAATFQREGAVPSRGWCTPSSLKQPSGSVANEVRVGVVLHVGP